MKVSLKFRFYPDEPQKEMLARTFGCVRLVYNELLQLRTDSFKAGVSVNYNASSQALTDLKKTPEKAFLTEVSCVPLQQSLRHLQTAFTNFFAKRAAYPAFKRRRGGQSAQYTVNGFKWKPQDRSLTIAKLGRLDVRWSREFTSHPTTVTITKDPSGRYFVTLCLDEAVQALSKTGGEVGIDLGVIQLATLSTGERIPNPRHTNRRAPKLARLQRVLARRKDGSGRWQRQRQKVARCHARIADARKDHLDKVTTDIVRRFDVIALKDLHVRGMMRDHRFARVVSDAGLGTFRTMVEYKARWYGKEVRIADRFFPSSKRCSACGHVHPRLRVDARQFACEKCGAVHDRDVNAAKNICEFTAVGQTVKARGEKVRPNQASAGGGTSRRNVNPPTASAEVGVSST